jgi:probable F420-dependent oxidoreductase
MAATVRVGVQLHPQATTVDELRAAWREADSMGVDSLWLWDHFYPLYGDPDATHFECYSLLAAMAADTERATVGALVTCNSYRNPDLLADMARTIDHIATGRFVLGIGAGWFQRDYEEYGYDFASAPARLRALADSLPRIKARLGRLNPPPTGALPILVGGAGEQITLRLVAEHADAWNTFGPPDTYRHKSEVLDRWCAEVGRDPSTIERTVGIGTGEVDRWGEYVDAGAGHLIVMTGPPFDLGPVVHLLEEIRT